MKIVKEQIRLDILMLLSTLVVVGCFMLTNSFMVNTIKNNNDLFEISHSFINMTNVYGQNSYRIANSFTFSTYMQLDTIWPLAYPERNTSEALKAVKQAFNFRLNVQKPFVPDPANTIERQRQIDVFENAMDGFTDSLSKSARYPTLFQTLYSNDYQLRSRFTEPTIQSKLADMNVSLIMFFRYFENSLIRRNQIQMIYEPFLNGKSPPFNLPDNLSRLVYPSFYNLGVGALRNVLDGAFPAFRRVIAEFKVSLIAPSSAFVGLIATGISMIIIVLILTAWLLVRKLNQRLTLILASYQYLRMDEAFSIQETLGKRLAIIRSLVFNEEKMIWKYLTLGMTRIGTRFNYQQAKLPQLKKIKKRKIDFILDKNFISGRAFLILLLILFSTLAMFAGLMLGLYKDLNASYEVEQLFFDINTTYLTIQENILVFFMYSVYGNFFKIAGKPMGQYDESNSILAFNNLFTSNRIKIRGFLSEADAQNLEDVIYGNMCKAIPTNRSNYQDYMNYCSQNEAAQKGFLTFLNFEKLELDDLRTQVDSLSDFLEKSKSQDLLVEGASIYFSDRMKELRILHDMLGEVFYTRFVFVLEQLLSKTSKKLSASLSTLYTLALFLSIFVVLLAFFIQRKIAHKELDIARETFANISPEIIKENSVLLAALESYYKTKR